MEDVFVLFRFTEHAFGITGWGIVWVWFFLAVLSWSRGRS